MPNFERGIWQSQKKNELCINKSHHASQRCVPRWDFVFYKGMGYEKQPISIEEQLSLLKSRGLVIGDDSVAKLQLRNISYFRIVSYLRYLEEDRQSRLYKSGSTFDQAINLYLFDRDLRQIVFRAIQDVEISLRAKMIQVFSMEYGAFWFMDSSLFTSNEFYEGCLDNIKKEVSRSMRTSLRNIQKGIPTHRFLLSGKH